MQLLHEANSDQDLEKFLTNSELWANTSFRYTSTLKLEKIFRQAKIEESRSFTDTEVQFKGRVLEAFGLSPEQAQATWEAWGSYNPRDEQTGQLSRDKLAHFADEILGANLAAMAHMESLHPGAVAKLQAPPYGIKHFRRYPINELVWQTLLSRNGVETRNSLF